MNWFKPTQDHQEALERYQQNDDTYYLYMYDREAEPLDECELEVVSIQGQ